MPDFTIRRVDDALPAQALHMLTFPHDEWVGANDGDVFWLAHDKTGTPVAFASVRPLEGEPGVFLSRCGVLPCARGAGLQRRLIQARCRWAKRRRYQYALTYVVKDNPVSLLNLTRCGFRLYTPAWKWAGDVHYLWRDL